MMPFSRKKWLPICKTSYKEGGALIKSKTRVLWVGNVREKIDKTKVIKKDKKKPKKKHVTFKKLDTKQIRKKLDLPKPVHVHSKKYRKMRKLKKKEKKFREAKRIKAKKNQKFKKIVHRVLKNKPGTIKKVVMLAQVSKKNLKKKFCKKGDLDCIRSRHP